MAFSCGDKWALAVVSCAGAGFVPGAPGTAGALVGTAAAVLTVGEPVWQVAMLGAGLVAGLWWIPRAERLLGPDPSAVVIDEFCGALIVFAGLPMTWLTTAVGFAAFRIFDVLKPPPIGQLERLPGAWGVLADDVAAGGLARPAGLMTLSLS